MIRQITVLQKADKYCFTFSHPDKHSMSVSKQHFERPHNIDFDLAELLSMQEPKGIYIRGRFIIEAEDNIQTSPLLNFSCSEFFSETAALQEHLVNNLFLSPSISSGFITFD